MKLPSRLGAIFVVVYLAVFCFTELIAFYSLIFNTAHSELSGVLAILVTLPWSMALVPLWEWVGFIKWYDRFAGTPALYGFFGMLAILPGALINAVIVYHLGKALDRGGRKA